MAIWIAALLIITAVALFVAAPLTELQAGISAPEPDMKRQNFEREHALAVQALRELEFDRAMGKLDADDYRFLRQRLEARALAAMRSIEGDATPSGSRSDLRPANGGRATFEKGNFCWQCGARSNPTHNFCPDCGALRE